MSLDKHALPAAERPTDYPLAHTGQVLLRRIDGWLAKARTLAATTSNGETERRNSHAQRQGLLAELIDLHAFATHLPYDGSHYRSAISHIRALLDAMVALLPKLSELEDLDQSPAGVNTSYPRSVGHAQENHAVERSASRQGRQGSARFGLPAGNLHIA